MIFRIVIAFLILCTTISSCNQNNDAKIKKKGEDMAKVYCGSCHQFPDPALLTKKIWTNKVLPNMATRMGFKWGYPYQGLDAEEVKELINRKFFPEDPVISEEMMLRIVKYYENNAPAKPYPQKRSISPDTNFNLFAIKNIKRKSLSTQNILFKTFPKEKFLIKSFEDFGTWQTDMLGNNSKKISKISASDVHIFNDKLYLLNIRNTKPSNLPKGSIIEYNFEIKNQSIAIDSLIRPVNMDITDLNLDNKPDFIICEFGDYLGQLSLHISNSKGYKKIILKDYPGACKAKFVDINHDGKLDIVVAMSQAKEELLIFYNKGNFNFEEKSISKFPSSFGLNNMQIEDIDNDGLQDILITNGDNADISSQLKNYHGIRIYKNLGNSKFKLAWFYPIYGASNIVVEDFDQDAKKDFAIISHFPDFNDKKHEDFVFFKNLGNNKYKPYKFLSPFNGRLLTLDKADFDLDGDMDIVIGNYIDNLTDPGVTNYTNWQKANKESWVLENKLK